MVSWTVSGPGSTYCTTVPPCDADSFFSTTTVTADTLDLISYLPAWWLYLSKIMFTTILVRIKYEIAQSIMGCSYDILSTPLLYLSSHWESGWLLVIKTLNREQTNKTIPRLLTHIKWKYTPSTRFCRPSFHLNDSFAINPLEHPKILPSIHPISHLPVLPFSSQENKGQAGCYQRGAWGRQRGEMHWEWGLEMFQLPPAQYTGWY